MQYSQVQPGRTFYLRVDNDEDLHDCVVEVCRRENVSRAWFHVFGAMAFSSLVVGPVREEIPPVRVVREATGVHELLGVGSVMPGEDGAPAIHIHAALGRGEEALVGCLQTDTRVFLVQEILLVELHGDMVRRAREGAVLPVFPDPES